MTISSIRIILAMKNIAIIILSGLFIFTSSIEAQQLYQMSQYMVNPVIYNPAASGLYDAVWIYGAGRNQWMGFKDQNNETIQPRNMIAGANIPIHSINSMIGFHYNLEKLAYQSRSDFKLDYAYKLNIGKKQSLSLGISGQISQMKLDIDKLIPLDSTDPINLTPGKQKDLIPEIGVGIFYASEDRFWAGFSLLNLLGSKATLGNIIMDDQMAAVIQAQYKISLINERKRKIELAPSFLVKSNFTNTQVEVDLLAYINNMYWLGTGYRLQDGIILLAGMHIKDFLFGISYDVTIGKMNEATKAGSAEIHLSYCFPVKKSAIENQKRTFRNNNGKKIKYESGFNTRHL
jgi:type IX secretion system PorP/SprF family membrane protein